MNIKKIAYFLVFINLSAREAVVLKPVVDLFGDKEYAQMKLKMPNSSNNCARFCPRIFQAAYNMVVDVVEEDGDFVKIEIKNAIYHDSKSGFWAKKKCFVYLDSLEPENRELIPSGQNRCLTLIEPISSNNLKLSAGTKLVIKEENSDNFIARILLIDQTNRKLVIPKDLCITNKCDVDNKLIFVSILKHWANNKNGFIPYVWGGCSFTTRVPHTEPMAVKIVDEIENFDYGFYKHKVKSGFDCSAMIWLAAQIANIDMAYRNTTMIEKRLNVVTSDIQNGDILWFKGHVIVITDIENNLCIEARSYSSGYGKVHEIAINKLFENIKSIDELMNAYRTKTPLMLLNIKGEPYYKIDEFKILRF